MQSIRIETLEINPSICNQQIFDKQPKIILWKKGTPFKQTMFGKLDFYLQKFETISLPYNVYKNKFTMGKESKLNPPNHQITRRKYRENAARQWPRQIFLV